MKCPVVKCPFTKNAQDKKTMCNIQLTQSCAFVMARQLSATQRLVWEARNLLTERLFAKAIRIGAVKEKVSK